MVPGISHCSSGSLARPRVPTLRTCSTGPTSSCSTSHRLAVLEDCRCGRHCSLTTRPGAADRCVPADRYLALIPNIRSRAQLANHSGSRLQTARVAETRREHRRDHLHADSTPKITPSAEYFASSSSFDGSRSTSLWCTCPRRDRAVRAVGTSARERSVEMAPEPSVGHHQLRVANTVSATGYAQCLPASLPGPRLRSSPPRRRTATTDRRSSQVDMASGLGWCCC